MMGTKKKKASSIDYRPSVSALAMVKHYFTTWINDKVKQKSLKVTTHVLPSVLLVTFFALSSHWLIMM